MRRGRRRIVAIAMAAVMACSFTACSKSNGSGSGGNQAKTDTKDMVYQAEEVNFEGIQGDFSTYVVKDDKIWFTTYEWFEDGGAVTDTGTDDQGADDSEATSEEAGDSEATSEEADDSEATSEEADDSEATSEEESGDTQDGAEATSEEGDTAEDMEPDATEELNYTSITRLYSANLDGTNVTEIPLTIGQQENIQSMCVDAQNNLVLLLGNYGDEKVSYSTVVLDASGKELSRNDITKALNFGTEDYLSKMMMDDEGLYYFAKEQSIIVLDADGKQIQEIKPEGNVSWMEGVALTKDNQIVYGYSDEDGAMVQVVDPKTGKKGEAFKTELSYFGSSDSLMSGAGDYDFYYKDDSGVYGYSIADKKSVKVLDYVASDLNSMNASGLLPIADGKFAGVNYNYAGKGDDGSSVFCVYSKVDPSQIKDKITITYGGMWVSDEIKTAAIAFNKASDKYKIVFQDYSNEEDPETKFNADIIAGNVPDIIDLSGISISQYASMGILEDLIPYYEKDTDVKLEDIIDSVAEAMKIDGKLYYVAPSLSIYTMIAKKSDVGDASGWTMKEMLELVKSKAPSSKPFLDNTKESLMYSMISQNLGEFVDWGTGKCSFDGDSFKEMLEFCNSGDSGEPDYDNMPSLPEEVQAGRVFLQTDTINFESVEMYEKMFKDDITFIGYPCEDKSGSYFSFNQQMGIYSKSEVKDAAWEFIKTFMSKDFQYNNTWWGTPTRKDVFEMKVKEMTATEPYTDEMGNEKTPYQSSWGWDNFEIELEPLTEKQISLYRELLESTHKVSNYNSQIMSIISEETKAYFAGEKSVDETVKLIQNRVTTYVNENR